MAMSKTVYKDFESFAERQSCDYVSSDTPFKIGTNTYRPGYMFENGAFVDHNGWEFLEPADNPVHRAIMQVQYVERCIERLQAVFKSKKENAAIRASVPGRNTPPMTEHDLKELEEIAAEVGELRKREKKLRKIIDNTPEKKKQRKRDAELQERIAEQRRLVQAMNGINLP